MSEAEVIEKIHKLPSEVQEHLFLYVDFLYETYHVERSEENEKNFFQEHELTDAGKAFFQQRIEQGRAHPEKRIPWREAREKIHKKYNWPL